ncbi:hypothetical protein DFR70_12680 [Nocardia tenerifensis]|uniref:Uncharacterized protein n=1 Tax=Nocardia tenerifensis TaxID=228006 RepID=A0A318JL60_9NOCA|nr:hypothetical protein DFR70_12680 [Nocardia tenerifensis]
MKAPNANPPARQRNPSAPIPTIDQGAGPWITTAHCGWFRLDSHGAVAKARCPGLFCGQLVAVVDGVLAAHSHANHPAACAWAGVGVRPICGTVRKNAAHQRNSA